MGLASESKQASSSDIAKKSHSLATSSQSKPHHVIHVERNGPNADEADETTTRPVDPRRRKWKTSIVSILSDQWFIIAMGVLIAIASQVQVPLAHQKLKETVVTYLCVSVIFLITGCTLDTKVLLQNYSRWRLHLFVQVQCFLLSSALIFGIVSATALNEDFMDAGLLVGLIFMGCVATTMSSNVVMTGQAHGNQALTVVQTTVGNFVGVFISPALVVMYTTVPTWYNKVLPKDSGNFPGIYRRVLMQLGLSIYLPLVVGQIVRHHFPAACDKIFRQWQLKKIGSLCMLTIIWQTYDQAFASHAFDSVPASNMIFLVFISIAIWVVLFMISFCSSLLWLSKKDAVAISYCVPAKGTAIGVPLSTTIFVGLSLELQSKIQIPIVIYQGLQILFGSILIVVFRRWIDNDEKQKQRAQPSIETHVSKQTQDV